MTTKTLAALIAATLGIVVLCALGGAALFGSGITGCSLPLPASGPALNAPPAGWPPIGTYRSDQVAMAATIVSVGAQMGVSVRGWVIGVATAIQESDLSNPAGGDQDSIGLFQQCPSQGWGTPDQLHDPVYASGQFFAKLLTISDWQDMTLTDAAQAVQRSAYPTAYAKWEPDATMLVNTLGGGVFWDTNAGPDTGFACDADGGDGQPNGGSVTLPADYNVPPTTPPAVATAIFWALGQLGTSYAFGGSCTDPHGPDMGTHCDSSCLVTLSPLAVRTGDQRLCFEDAVVDAHSVDVVGQFALMASLLSCATGCTGGSRGPGQVHGQWRLDHGRSSGGRPRKVAVLLGTPQ